MKKLILILVLFAVMQAQADGVSRLEKNMNNISRMFYRDSTLAFEYLLYEEKLPTYVDDGFNMCEFIGYGHRIMLCFDNNELTFASITFDKKIKRKVFKCLDKNEFKLQEKDYKHIWLFVNTGRGYFGVIIYDRKKGCINYFPIR
jgi:hypothetical protein